MGDVKDAGDLVATILSHNYTLHEAKELVLAYKRIIGKEGSAQRAKYLCAINSITLAKIIPAEDLTGIGVSVEKESLHNTLWHLGINTEYSFTFDVGCFNTNGRVRCGLYIIGQERTDNEWVELVINGKRVASLEAIFRSTNDPSMEVELSILSGS